MLDAELAEEAEDVAGAEAGGGEALWVCCAQRRAEERNKVAMAERQESRMMHLVQSLRSGQGRLDPLDVAVGKKDIPECPVVHVNFPKF